MEKQLTFPFLVLMYNFCLGKCNLSKSVLIHGSTQSAITCEIYSKLTPCSSVSIVNFEHVIASCVVSAFENNS